MTLSVTGPARVSPDGQQIAYRYDQTLCVRRLDADLTIRRLFTLPSSQPLLLDFSRCGQYVLFHAPGDSTVHVLFLDGPCSNPLEPLQCNEITQHHLSVIFENVPVRAAYFTPSPTLLVVTDVTAEVIELNFLREWKPRLSRSGSARPHGVHFIQDGVERRERALGRPSFVQRAIHGPTRPFLISIEASLTAFVTNYLHKPRLNVIGTGNNVGVIVPLPSSPFDPTIMLRLGRRDYLIADLFGCTVYRLVVSTQGNSQLTKYERREVYQFNPALSRTLVLPMTSLTVYSPTKTVAILFANAQLVLLNSNLQERIFVTGLPDCISDADAILVECRHLVESNEPDDFDMPDNKQDPNTGTELETASLFVRTTIQWLGAQYEAQAMSFQLPKLLKIEAYLKRNARSGLLSRACFSASGGLLAYVGVEYPTTVCVLDIEAPALLAVICCIDVVAGLCFLGETLYILTSPFVREYDGYDLCDELHLFQETCAGLLFEEGRTVPELPPFGRTREQNRLFSWARGQRLLVHTLPLPAALEPPGTLETVRGSTLVLGSSRSVVLIDQTHG